MNIGTYSTLAGKMVRLAGFAIMLVADLNTVRADESVAYRYESRLTKQPLNGERQRHVAAMLSGNRVGIFGGFGISTVEIFDVANETFRLLTAKQWFGDLSGIALTNGRALLVSGSDHEFDPETEKFVSIEKVFAEKCARWTPMLTLPDGRVFACGGFDGSFKPIGNCAIFDPQTHGFEQVGKLAVPRARHTINLVNDHEILVTGGTGADYSNVSFDSVEMFDLKTRTSNILPVKLAQGRCNHGSAVLPDGRILLVGGYNPKHEVNTAEIFDPKTGTLSNGGSMIIPHGEPQVARLPSGRIAVFGGDDNARLIEIYCPDQKRFIPADQLTVEPRRMGFTVTGLPGGSLLIIGGRPNSSGEVLKTAEIFTEVRVAVAARPQNNGSELAALLGNKDGKVRDDATRRLIALGREAEAVVKPLLTNSDPEISYRAGQILKSLAAGAEAKWCVEIWDAKEKKDAIWFSDYHAMSCQNPKNADLLKLQDRLSAIKEPRLIARFPDGVEPEKQGRVLNAIGRFRTPSVSIGAPLPSLR